MAITLAFDVYGTLIDTSGISRALRRTAGDRAEAFSRLWRDKQLEYSFRRGLMRNYQNFAVCTENALEYACSVFQVGLPESERERLMAEYRVLPVFPDVPEAMNQLASAGIAMYAFSNGRAEDVSGLLRTADISDFFRDIISVDEIRSFKPDPAVYHHFLRRAKASGSESWLVSGNPFDVIGAVSAGMHAVWVRRSAEMVFDPWEIQPTTTISDLKSLKGAVTGQSDQG
jgi:2-haloacid dehalogenase